MTTAATRAEAFATLLVQHGADLSRLRGSRGMVRCILPGHDDGTPSLSVDLDAAVFHCFGCHAGGGLVHLRALLGEDLPRHETPAQHRLREHRAAEARWGDVLPLWRASDGMRHRRRVAASFRALARRWGAKHPACWPLLAQAARFETEVAQREAALDAALASERCAA